MKNMVKTVFPLNVKTLPIFAEKDISEFLITTRKKKKNHFFNIFKKKK